MISQAHLSQEAGNHYNIGIHFMNLPSHFSIHTLTQVYRCKMHQHVHFYATAKYSIQSLHQIWSVFVMPFEINTSGHPSQGLVKFILKEKASK